jgi:hypothetical protein
MIFFYCYTILLLALLVMGHYLPYQNFRHGYHSYLQRNLVVRLHLSLEHQLLSAPELFESKINI